MVMAYKEFNLQEYISMGFYCLVGTGVIVHWIHVWLGKPDYRVRELEARLRSLEEGDRIRDKFALASLGGYPQSVSSSRRGSTTACNTANGSNSISAGFNDSLFQATPSKRLRADSYFTTQHAENVSPHDCSPPPLVFSKPPPAGTPSQPASPVYPAAGPPGQALSCSETPYNRDDNLPATHALQGPFCLSKLTIDDKPQQNLVLDTATAAVSSPGPLSPPSRPQSSNSWAASRSRSHGSSFHSYSHQRNGQPYRYGFHYPHLPHLPPVNSGADNRVGHYAGMGGPGPLSD